MQASAFHILTVGWRLSLVEALWDPVSALMQDRFSHLLHPALLGRELRAQSSRADLHFFREDLSESLPEPDVELLAALEGEGVPTIHNMILGDRVVSRLPHTEALRYATFLARRLTQVFAALKPSMVIGGFDALHGGLALAVASHMQIPWYALHFTTLPAGMVCASSSLSPASPVSLQGLSPQALDALASESLLAFESKRIHAPAYIAPALSPAARLFALPKKIRGAIRTTRRARAEGHLKFTEMRSRHNLSAAVRLHYRTWTARRAASRVRALSQPPEVPYILFGLHMQPESSIDTWAPFFSNQMWVIELLSRSIPPSHKLLVKIHKSDLSNHTREHYERMRSFPGVELVAPFADTRAFIERADLLILIQGTMGLEAALLGKPVIMLGQSPFACFSSVSQIGKVDELPTLIREKLRQRRPDRSVILADYVRYLSPFFPASANHWVAKRTEEELQGYATFLRALKGFVVRSAAQGRVEATPQSTPPGVESAR